MMRSQARARTVAAFAVGLALGAVATAGIALLLYTGQGFLRAAGLLVSSTMMAAAAGLWAGTPESPRTAPPWTRARWAAFTITLLAGGLFAALWGVRAPLRDLAWGGALAVLLELALPAYAAGALLAGLHARDRALSAAGGAVAAAALAGSAFGVLLSATVLIQALEPYAIYYGAAVLLVIASLVDRPRVARDPIGGMDMTDRVVLITGAADRGQLGFTLARRFLQAGARVVISARDRIDEAAAALAADGDVLGVAADLSRDDDVTRLIDATRERFGRLDALVNVAGGLSLVASVADTSPEAMHHEIERNAGTALRLIRAALPLLRESRGSIINFASPAATRAPASLAAYSAAKAAVNSLTRALAIEEKKNGVRVNAIAPGMMDTAQNREQSGEDATFVSRDDVASVVIFLAGSSAGGVTGETIQVLGETIR